MNYKQPITNLTLGLILFIGFTYAYLFKENLVPVFILIAYISYHLYDIKCTLKKISRVFLMFLFVASIVAFISYSFKYYGPRDWDFTCFFLYGNVAVKGLNFYNPNDYYAILKTLPIPVQLDSVFMKEVIDVGCIYPPPAIFLFSILGFFSYDKALMIWTIINNLFLLGSIYLVSKIFFKRKGFEGIMISTVLVLPFKSILLTVYYSQILFILLFFLLLFYKYRDKPLGGLFLALAIFIKPFVAVLLLYYLIKRQKMGFLFFLVSCLVICIVTALTFGIHPFIEYLIDNPTQRVPEWFFTDEINKSLLAQLYRKLPDNKLLANIIYYITSIILMLLFGKIIYQYKNRSEMSGVFFVIILAVGLIVYPSGMNHYPVVHLVSIFVLLEYLKKVEVSSILVFLIYLVSYLGLFYINLFLLTVCLLIIYGGKIQFIYYEVKDLIKIGA